MSAPPLTLRFDAGTLRLENLDRDEGAGLPPSCLWDARIARFRAPAFAYRELVLHLTSRAKTGGRTFVDEARSYATLTLTHRAVREAFPHQREALERWMAQGKRGVVVLPTGAGKSYLAELAIHAVQRSTLVVAPTLDLMGQWADVLATAFGIEIGLLGGGYHELRALTVATYDSAYLHMDRLGARFGLIVFDECHHLPSASYLNAAEAAIAPYRLGLTATPARADGREALLDERVGPVAYERGIKSLSGEMLSGYETVRLSVPLASEEAARYQAQREVYRAFVRDHRIQMGSPDGWGRFLQLSSRSSEGRRAFLAYREQKLIATASGAKLDVVEGLLRQHAGDRVLLFTSDNETVHLLSRTFLIPALTHQTDLQERREILARFGEGTYRAVVTSRVLNEGVNLPSANVAIVLSGSGSVREHVQRLGRILRKQDGKHAVLYELVSQGTAEEHVSERRREHEAYR